MLIYVSLLTGPMPLTVGEEQGLLTTPWGRMDLPSIRLLGLWVAAWLVVVLHIGRVWQHVSLWRFHACFLLFCILSLVWAPSFIYGVRTLAKLSSPFLFLLLIMSVVSSQRQLRMMERLILVSGVLMVTLAIGSMMAGMTTWGGEERLTVLGQPPASFSMHLVATLALALANVKYGNAIRYWPLVAVFSIAVVGAVTRISIMALFGALSVILFMTRAGLGRIIFPILGLVGAPAVLLLNDSFRNRMFYQGHEQTAEGILSDPLSNVEYLNLSGRYGVWREAWNQFFLPNPLFGSGIGTTQEFLYTHPQYNLSMMHSEYIRLLAEVGLVGLLLFILACCAYAVRLIRAYRSHPQSLSGKYAVAGLGGLIAYVIFMATDNAFEVVNQLGIYVFGFIAMSEKARQLELLEVDQSRDNHSDLQPENGLLSHTNGSGDTKVRRYKILSGR
jgi:O-antigen ligase